MSGFPAEHKDEYFAEHNQTPAPTKKYLKEMDWTVKAAPNSNDVYFTKKFGNETCVCVSPFPIRAATSFYDHPLTRPASSSASRSRTLRFHLWTQKRWDRREKRWRTGHPP